jgi:hypothetical protein
LGFRVYGPRLAELLVVDLPVAIAVKVLEHLLDLLVVVPDTQGPTLLPLFTSTSLKHTKYTLHLEPRFSI